jgi:hypothetical protein
MWNPRRGGGSANIKMGTITTSSSSSGDTVTIDCGFKPKKIFVYNNISENKIITDVYDEDLNSTYQVLGYRQNSSGSACNRYSINGTSNMISMNHLSGTHLVQVEVHCSLRDVLIFPRRGCLSLKNT